MERISEEKACLCALNRLFGFAPRAGIALIDCFGSGKAVFEADARDIDRILGPFSKFRGSIVRHEAEKSAMELENLYADGYRFIGITESCYPELLREIEDPPIGIYIKSESAPEEILSGKRDLISVVGTRDISPYGSDWCRKIVRGIALGGKDVTIVSGLAYGVDIRAHLTAIECGIPTVAVMATGIDSVYPSRHYGYAQDISRIRAGALITDYPPGTPPVANNFLRRNRIIAALSRATVLVESKIRGGGMMTARLAFSYNREVYALPGRADDIRSQGCNRLIAEKTAEAVESVETLLKSLGMDAGKKAVESGKDGVLQKYAGTLSPEDNSNIRAVLNDIRGHRGTGIDETASRTGLSYKDCSRMISLLESEGLITGDLIGRFSSAR